jgi:hypothetical protein
MQDPHNDPTPPLRTGARRQGNIFSFQSRDKNVLDISSYRPGVSASVRFSFAFSADSESYRDITTACRFLDIKWPNSIGWPSRER